MGYVMLTAKHHEGFALWPTATRAWNVMSTPARRDLIAPLADAVRTKGLRFGLYYSQSQDWMNPGGAKRNPGRLRGERQNLDDGEGWSEEHKGSYDAYLKNVALPQVEELLNRYEPALLWWDTPIAMTPERAKPFQELAARHPRMLTNDRLGGNHRGTLPGDYSTPEQYVPPYVKPGDRFETCMTINDAWGYASHSTRWKSATQLLQALSDAASKGGNLFLGVGPKPDGTIQQEVIDRLREMGAWLRVNGAAIYGTKAGPFPRDFWWGRSTRRATPGNGEILYLHIWDYIPGGRILLPTLHQLPRSALFLDGNNKTVATMDTSGGLVIRLPEDRPASPHITVLALAFGEPLRISLDAFVSPDEQGVFTLTPFDAGRWGSGAGVMQVRGRGDDACITDWFLRWRLTYRIKVSAAQSYRITAEIAAADPVSLRVGADKGGPAVVTKLASTGRPDNWRVMDLGVIELQPGDATLTLRGIPEETWRPISIRNLVLTPVDK